jgi:F-type H+-transporting ATPase subunit b
MFNEKFWLAIAFLTFVVFIIKLVGPKMLKALDQKSKEIAEEILAARELREKAVKLLAAAETYHQESMIYSQKLISDAELEAKNFLAEAEKNVTEEVTKRTNAAYERIKNEEEKTLREVKSAIVATALKTIEDEAAKNLDKKNSDYLLSEATQNFGKIIH